jgi:hypothetical protein
MENIKEAVDKIHRDFHMAITTADEKLAEMLGLIVIDSGDRVRAKRLF